MEKVPNDLAAPKRPLEVCSGPPFGFVCTFADYGGHDSKKEFKTSNLLKGVYYPKKLLTNGLRLRSNLHRLFDLGDIAIPRDPGCIVVPMSTALALEDEN
jgi:hypothetical protein